MNETLFTLNFFGHPFIIDGWKFVGFSGTFIFAGRWFVQMEASRRKGKPVVPVIFWYMSLVGSTLCLLYFIFGKNDSVGIVNNLFPATVSIYNLYLVSRGRPKLMSPGESEETPPTSGPSAPASGK